MKKIFSLETGKNWWQGKVTVNYNLLIVALVLATPFIIIYFILRGLWLGVKWFATEAVAPAAVWIWGVLTKFFVWLKELFKRPAEQTTDKPKREPNYNWLWLVLALLLLLGLLLTWRSCSSDDRQEPTAVYTKAFDEVIIARAYLDGVQEKVSENCPRALVGFKFINDKSVANYDFNGMTYDQAVRVVAEDWRPLVLDNLNPEISLNKQQMAVITLAAMRMGKYGFARSTFLQKVNEGKFEEAEEWLLLQKADGTIRKTGAEPKQYFYILRLLWRGEISVEDLADWPMFSYKALDVKSIYDADGQAVCTPEIREQLERGEFIAPREALGF